MNEEHTKVDYVVLLKQLRRLISDKKGAGEEATSLRNQMDDLWLNLTAEDIKWVDELMDKGYTKMFEAWKKEQRFQLTYLYDRTGEFGPDIETICRRAFEAGLKICTCGRCPHCNPRYFDVEGYYE